MSDFIDKPLEGPNDEESAMFAEALGRWEEDPRDARIKSLLVKIEELETNYRLLEDQAAAGIVLWTKRAMGAERERDRLKAECDAYYDGSHDAYCAGDCGRLTANGFCRDCMVHGGVNAYVRIQQAMVGEQFDAGLRAAALFWPECGDPACTRMCGRCLDLY